MAASLTLKVELDSDVRRLKGWPEAGAQPTVAALHKTIVELFNLEAPTTLSIKYRDEEGDLCTLIEATLADALELAARRSHVLRLVCVVDTSPATNSAAARSAESGDASTGGTPAGDSDEAAPGAFGTASEASPPRTTLPTEASFPIGESWTSVPPHATRAPASVQCCLATRVAAARERLERRRPQIVEACAHLKQQVVSDYRASHNDMKQAFQPPHRLAEDAEQPPTIRQVSNVAATAAGIVKAARLLPVRAVKIAAQGVAAARASDDMAAPAPSEDPSLAASATQESAAAADVATPSSEHSGLLFEGAAEGRTDGFEHFQNQVVDDFRTARRDIQAAFDCVLGTAASTDATEEAQRPSQRIKALVPRVASTVVGCSVAASLLPVHAARLVVATAAAAHSDAGDAPSDETEQQASNPADVQLASDEELARQLQAAWNAEAEVARTISEGTDSEIHDVATPVAAAMEAEAVVQAATPPEADAGFQAAAQPPVADLPVVGIQSQADAGFQAVEPPEADAGFQAAAQPPAADLPVAVIQNQADAGPQAVQPLEADAGLQAAAAAEETDDDAQWEFPEREVVADTKPAEQ